MQLVSITSTTTIHWYMYPTTTTANTTTTVHYDYCCCRTFAAYCTACTSTAATSTSTTHGTFYCLCSCTVVPVPDTVGYRSVGLITHAQAAVRVHACGQSPCIDAAKRTQVLYTLPLCSHHSRTSRIQPANETLLQTSGSPPCAWLFCSNSHVRGCTRGSAQTLQFCTYICDCCSSTIV